MARAYAIIANGGGDVIPFSIRYVQNLEGETILNTEKEITERIARAKKDGSYQVIKPETAQVMISLMSSVVAGGTGMAANANRPTAGKTGTTNNYRDAWFVDLLRK
jgi:penicillin-binding protein 1A